MSPNLCLQCNYGTNDILIKTATQSVIIDVQSNITLILPVDAVDVGRVIEVVVEVIVKVVELVFNVVVSVAEDVIKVEAEVEDSI